MFPFPKELPSACPNNLVEEQVFGVRRREGPIGNYLHLGFLEDYRAFAPLSAGLHQSLLRFPIARTCFDFHRRQREFLSAVDAALLALAVRRAQCKKGML